MAFTNISIWTSHISNAKQSTKTKHKKRIRHPELVINIRNVQFSTNYYKAWKETKGPFPGEINAYCPQGSTDIGFNKDFKSPILNMLKELRKTTDKKLKETRRMMSLQ